MSGNEIAVKCSGITKTFGGVVANDDINLEVKYGEILALLGENGSGKTTLMNMLSGIYHPDKGTIAISGKTVAINSPKDSIALGIGMIHQHFKLVEVFTAADNIVAGTKGSLKGKGAVRDEINKISEQLGLEVDPDKKVYNMSVSEKQTVEILKVLYRGANILILDEPTAGQDYRHYTEIMEFLKKLNEEYGITIIMITHDMHLMLEYTNRAVVIADGRLLADTAPAAVLTDDAVADRAYLKKTSLYDLAVRCGIAEPTQFVERFIGYERQMRAAEREEEA